MKKRFIKKYVNRYINSIVKGLPKTDTFAQRVEKMVDGVEMVEVYAINHTIVNGEIKGEGFRSNGCQDVLRNIRLSGAVAKQIIDSHNHVYLRLFQINGNHVRLRLITE